MSKYFRITAYNEDLDMSCIFDSNGFKESLLELSKFLIEHQFKIIHVSLIENIIDSNIENVEYDEEHLCLQDYQDGKIKIELQKTNNKNIKIIKVGDSIYTE